MGHRWYLAAVSVYVAGFCASAGRRGLRAVAICTAACSPTVFVASRRRAVAKGDGGGPQRP